MENILKGKNILIVDDEPDLREVFCDEFKSHDCNTFQAENGRVAFNIVREQNNIDVIVSDIRMPGGDGVELLERVTSECGSLPVVLLITGFSDLPCEDAYHIGAHAIMSKPCDVEDLINKVKSVITPRERRWAVPVAAKEIKTSLLFEFDNFSNALSSRRFNVGLGGLFIQIEKNFPKKDEHLHFEMRFADSPAAAIEGTGFSRWVRRSIENELKPGIGIEIESVSDATRAHLLDLIKRLRPKAYIPKS